MNSINIVGRITQDIELKMTPEGVDVCTFCVAVPRPGVRDVTDFFSCVAWREKAVFCSNYFRKGDGICVTGILTTRQYQDREQNKKTVYEILCREVSFGMGKKEDYA